MKARIDSDGKLWIVRAGVEKVQYCPFTEEEGRKCGDWCPQFWEPKPKDVVLCICHGRILGFESELIDERPRRTEGEKR
jgi:hypothetical protein